ncbi:MAG: hypothetical protein ACOCQT_01850 [Desulfovermiculus sp.]
MDGKVTIMCKICKGNFQGEAWRKSSGRDRVCPTCRRLKNDDFGVKVDPYVQGLERTTPCHNEPDAVIMPLMCGMY